MTADRDEPDRSGTSGDETSVSDITIERESHVAITFDDGLVATFPVAALRAACPCATCRGFRERGDVAWPRVGQADTISIRSAELTGAWGLSITWSDGHDTGIYAWAALRRWWQAGFDEPLTPEA